MNENHISLLEAFHNTFTFFIQELDILTWSDAKQGELGDRWEIQQEVYNDGEYVLKNSGSFLMESERAEILSLLNKISNLPSDALWTNEGAMNHPQWEELRHDARDLLKHLARPIAAHIAWKASRAFLIQVRTWTPHPLSCPCGASSPARGEEQEIPWGVHA